MGNRITRILVITFLASLGMTTLLLAMLLSQRPIDQNTMRCDFSGLVFGIGWGIIFLMTISTTTLYLNLYKRIRTHRWLILLSFFLMPLLTTSVLLIAIGDIAEGWKECSAIFLPYLIILTIQFFRFRRSGFVTEQRISRNHPGDL